MKDIESQVIGADASEHNPPMHPVLPNEPIAEQNLEDNFTAEVGVKIFFAMCCFIAFSIGYISK